MYNINDNKIILLKTYYKHRIPTIILESRETKHHYSTHLPKVFPIKLHKQMSRF